MTQPTEPARIQFAPQVDAIQWRGDNLEDITEFVNDKLDSQFVPFIREDGLLGMEPPGGGPALMAVPESEYLMVFMGGLQIVPANVLGKYGYTPQTP